MSRVYTYQQFGPKRCDNTDPGPDDSPDRDRRNALHHYRIPPDNLYSPIRVAYADPPYPGCAHMYLENEEVDHAQLIARLMDEFPDGWALSTHIPGLRIVLPLCPDDVRVMAWVKPFAAFKPNVGVAYAWEPVIVRGGRKRTREQPTVRDWVAENITLRTGMVGAKPEGFCRWLFSVLNLRDGDELVDLYPGSGAVGRAWERWRTGAHQTQWTEMG